MPPNLEINCEVVSLLALITVKVYGVQYSRKSVTYANRLGPDSVWITEMFG